MKTGILAFVLCFASFAFADDTTVRGHVRRDGVYVPPHHRTTPNDTLRDNYSTQGNTNPYTGRPGHVNPYPAPSYGDRPSYPNTPHIPSHPQFPQYPITR